MTLQELEQKVSDLESSLSTMQELRGRVANLEPTVLRVDRTLRRYTRFFWVACAFLSGVLVTTYSEIPQAAAKAVTEHFKELTGQDVEKKVISLSNEFKDLETAQSIASHRLEKEMTAKFVQLDAPYHLTWDHIDGTGHNDKPVNYWKLAVGFNRDLEGAPETITTDTKHRWRITQP